MADQHDAREKGYEDYDLNIGPIVFGTLGIVAVAILSFIAMWAMFHGLEQAALYLSDEPAPMVAHQKPHTGPLIQVIPEAELAEVRSQNQRVLSGYGWIDKDAGVTYIPLDRAIDLALQRGFPVRK